MNGKTLQRLGLVIFIGGLIIVIITILRHL